MGWATCSQLNWFETNYREIATYFGVAAYGISFSPELKRLSRRFLVYEVAYFVGKSMSMSSRGKLTLEGQGEAVVLIKSLSQIICDE